MKRSLVVTAAIVIVASCRQGPPAESAVSRYDIGTRVTEAQLVPFDIDVNPAGKGLPAGSGTAAQGAVIYAQKCAMCHGANGEGQGPFPKLIGAEPRTGFPFGRDVKLVKTIGNYWPYSTTVFDYVRRAMPFIAPGSLQPNEIYSLTAFLLARNEIIPESTVIDAHTLPAIKMPAHDHFVPDNRKNGGEFR